MWSSDSGPIGGPNLAVNTDAQRRAFGRVGSGAVAMRYEPRR